MQLFRGQTLVCYCYLRLKEQVAVNANRNQERYAQFGLPVFADELVDFQGLLNSILMRLRLAHSDFVLFVPYERPFLPLNLLEKLQ